MTRKFNLYAKKRDKILDEMLRLKKEYLDCKEGGILVRSANEVLKYGQLQDPLPTIPRRYLVDLAANISIDEKIDRLVGLIERRYQITKQEREFLKSFYK